MLLFVVVAVITLLLVMLSLLSVVLGFAVRFDEFFEEAAEEMPGALCQETSKRPRDGMSDDWAMN